MKEHYQQIRHTNTAVLVLSTDTQRQSASLKAEMALPFHLLCDPDKQVVSSYNLLNPHEHGGIAYPAIFVIRADGIIGYRSLDRTAQRVNLSEVLDYLSELNRNPNHQVKSTAKKSLIMPGPKTLRQILRNMVLRGNRKDWKHYVFYPFFVIRYLLGIVRRPDDKKE